MADLSPQKLARQLLGILYYDRDKRLLRIDDYLHGRHDDPYMPENADEEYKLLAQRAVSNWMPLLVNTPAQALYVDGFRSGIEGETEAEAAEKRSTESWQHSRGDARQHAVHRGALAYGHAFVVQEKQRKGKAKWRGLSALRTSAVYVDPANDIDPYAALTVDSWPNGDVPGQATMWDGTYKYRVSWKSGEIDKATCVRGAKHGASECPVTRLATHVDLEGRTRGVIEPLIPIQDRINQTVFDLLIAQTYGSFKIRYATGMAPPLQMRPTLEDPESPYDPEANPVVGVTPIIDPDTGQPKPANINLNAKRFLFAPDKDSAFGTLDGTPLDGYISSVEMSVKHLSATSQTPPHYLLGQIANLSAEALDAAEISLDRMIEELKSAYGESWERNDRIGAQIDGDDARAEDEMSETIWRDLGSRSLAQVADALGKLRQNVEAPVEGLWEMLPGMTQQRLEQWKDMHEQEDASGRLAQALSRATTDPSQQPLKAQQTATDHQPVEPR